MKKLFVFIFIFLIGLVSVSAYQFNYSGTSLSNSIVGHNFSNNVEIVVADGCQRGEIFSVDKNLILLNVSMLHTSTPPLWGILYNGTNVLQTVSIVYDGTNYVAPFNYNLTANIDYMVTIGSNCSNSYREISYNTASYPSHNGSVTWKYATAYAVGLWNNYTAFGLNIQNMILRQNISNTVNYFFNSSNEFLGESSSIILNLSKNVNQNFINSVLVYNGTVYNSSVRNDFSYYTLFSNDLINYDIGNFSYFWNVSLVDSISSWCYQESANQSNACGGLSNGSYFANASISSGNWTDGDWNTWAYGNWLDINYSKPINAQSDSFWQVSIVNTSIMNFVVENVSIPSGCWNYDNTKLVLKVGNLGWYPFIQSSANCFDGVNWVNIGGGSDWSVVFSEEAMMWHIITNTSTNFSSVNGSHVIVGDNVSFNIYNINTSTYLIQNVTIVMVGDSGSYYRFNTSNGTFFNNTIKSDSYIITFSSSGFNKIVLNKIINGGSSNIDVYFNGNVQNYLFIVQDLSNLQAIPNATITMSQNINGVITVYSQLVTDFSGTASFYLDPTATYSMVVVASGYDIFSGNVNPSQSPNYIRLTKGRSSFKSVFDDVSYSTSYSNNGNHLFFSMDINSLSNSLIYFYIDSVYLGVDYLDYYNTAPSGGVASISFPFNDSQTYFNVTYSFSSSLGNYSFVVPYHISSSSINVFNVANSTSNGTLGTGLFNDLRNTPNTSGFNGSITKGFFGLFLIMALAIFGLKMGDSSSAGLFMGGIGIGICMAYALLPITYCWISLGLIGIILLAKGVEY